MRGLAGSSIARLPRPPCHQLAPTAAIASTQAASPATAPPPEALSPVALPGATIGVAVPEVTAALHAGYSVSHVRDRVWRNFMKPWAAGRKFISQQRARRPEMASHHRCSRHH